jgi:hypothetical protein
MATACFLGLPAASSRRMFTPIARLLPDWTSGIAASGYAVSALKATWNFGLKTTLP